MKKRIEIKVDSDHFKRMIEKLKEEIAVLKKMVNCDKKYIEVVESLEKENAELKEKVEQLRKFLNLSEKRFKELEKENVELRREVEHLLSGTSEKIKGDNMKSAPDGVYKIFFKEIFPDGFYSLSNKILHSFGDENSIDLEDILKYINFAVLVESEKSYSKQMEDLHRKQSEVNEVLKKSRDELKEALREIAPEPPADRVIKEGAEPEKPVFKYPLGKKFKCPDCKTEHLTGKPKGKYRCKCGTVCNVELINGFWEVSKDD